MFFYSKNDTVHLADLIITHHHIKNLISPIDFPCEDFCHMSTNGLLFISMCILLAGAMYANTLRFVKYLYIETWFIRQLFWYKFSIQKIIDHAKIGHWIIYKWTQFLQKFSSFVSHVMPISGYVYIHIYRHKKIYSTLRYIQSYLPLLPWHSLYGPKPHVTVTIWLTKETLLSK